MLALTHFLKQKARRKKKKKKVIPAPQQVQPSLDHLNISMFWLAAQGGFTSGNATFPPLRECFFNDYYFFFK